MKCPRCGLPDRTSTPQCPGCGLTLGALDRLLGEPPARATRLHDGAGLLSETERSALEWSRRSAGELVVVTLENTSPVRPSEFAFWLFNRWDLAAPHRRGLLLLLALREQRVELEVGYGWEDLANDLATGEALDRHVLPPLRDRKYAAAIAAAVDALGAVVTPGPPATRDTEDAR